MRFCMNDVLYAFSYALDCVEHDLIGVSTHHGLRVAYLSILMGKEMGLDEQELLNLAACAVLHDNALTEYIQSEWTNGTDVIKNQNQMNVAPHCTMGEKNMETLPFYDKVKGVVLYHHEHADGSGAFGKKADETPVMAQLVHISDQIDAGLDLSDLTVEKYEQLKDFVHGQRGRMFSDLCVDLFDKTCSMEALEKMSGDYLISLFKDILPRNYQHFTRQESTGISNIFASIIDYKSKFTCTHSHGVAARCAKMAAYYGYPDKEASEFYFAGAVHDIGKLVIDRDILEKPGKLTNQEFVQIKNHAYYTHKILSAIEGFETITRWASLHHEKLNGSGYPFGKKADELDFNSRLMGCIDIYQALTEDRPYKKSFSHENSISILRQMADSGFVDRGIVEDLDRAFEK